jgi:membrane-associated phospholipid phosphatase
MTCRVLIFWLVTVQALCGQNRIDVNIFRTVNDHHTPFTDGFFKLQTNSVKPLLYTSAAGFLLTGIIAKDRKAEDTGVLLVATGIVNFGITHGLKAGFNRNRPYEALDNVHLPTGPEGTRSFPSGHTSTAFAMATMVSLQYPKWYVIVPSYAWAGLVGYSRMALGVHYPSDVLVGALVGAGSAYLIHRLRGPILRTKDRVFH